MYVYYLLIARVFIYSTSIQKCMYKCMYYNQWWIVWILRKCRVWQVINTTCWVIRFRIIRNTFYSFNWLPKIFITYIQKHTFKIDLLILIATARTTEYNAQYFSVRKKNQYYYEKMMNPLPKSCYHLPYSEWMGVISITWCAFRSSSCEWVGCKAGQFPSVALFYIYINIDVWWIINVWGLLVFVVIYLVSSDTWHIGIFSSVNNIQLII